MSLIDQFERAHLSEFAEAERASLPKQTWRTPDGQWWAPQLVLIGWRPRISDHWACLTLHRWVSGKRAHVDHVKLPAPLQQHNQADVAWAYIANTFGPGTVESSTPFGCVDLSCGMRSQQPLMIEFGTCAPVKFVLNLGREPQMDWMIVPYGCRFAFVFHVDNDMFGVQ